MPAAYEHIVILTGAGISAESGLDIFRDKNGIWSTYAIDEVATPQAFRRDPKKVHDFYNMRRRRVRKAHPNAAHYALARLEEAHDGKVWVVTQNVDDLHERAGSRRLIHMHGEILKVRCPSCGAVLHWEGDLTSDTPCPACDAVGRLRPHIVWFGEMPFEMDAIERHLEECDLFVSIGTSGNVYPAAAFIQTVRRNGTAQTVELNLDPSLGEDLFTLKLYGPAGEVVPMFVERLLAGQV